MCTGGELGILTDISHPHKHLVALCEPTPPQMTHPDVWLLTFHPVLSKLKGNKHHVYSQYISNSFLCSPVFPWVQEFLVLTPSIHLNQDSLAPQFMPRLTPDSAGWPLLCGFSSKALLPISSLGHVHQTQVTSTSSASFRKPYPWVILLGESHSLSAGREPAHDHTSFSIFEAASQGPQLIPKFISASSWWERL